MVVAVSSLLLLCKDFSQNRDVGEGEGGGYVFEVGDVLGLLAVCILMARVFFVFVRVCCLIVSVLRKMARSCFVFAGMASVLTMIRGNRKITC